MFLNIEERLLKLWRACIRFERSENSWQKGWETSSPQPRSKKKGCPNEIKLTMIIWVIKWFS